MKLFSRLFGRRTEKRAIGIDGNGNPINVGDLCAPSSLAGVNVSEQTALTLSTVYRAARVLSESVGTMPVKVYRRTADGREEYRTHPLWTLVHDEPNPNQSAVDFFCLLQWWAVLWGNAYAEVVRDGAGNVAQLWPVPPWSVQPTDGTHYLVHGEHNQTVRIEAADMLHIKGPSCDGSEGYRLVSLARESFGYSLALERFGSAYFGNHCRPGGVLTYPGEVATEAKEAMRASWAKLYGGPDNSGRPAILDQGITWTPFTVSNEAGQFIESKNAEVYSVCRWLGVDPIFLYEYGRATWNNAEAQTRNFLQFSLNPWLVKTESEINRKAVNKAERAEVYVEFLRESIVQMDTKTQHEVWATGVDKGWYTIDEVRGWLNLPKLPPKQLPPTPPVSDPTPDQTQGGTNGTA